MATSPAPLRRRWVAAVAAAALPLVGLAATPPAAGADTVAAPAGELVWKVSDQFVDHFTPKIYAPGSSLVASDGATLDAANVTTFTGGTGWADPATGAAAVQYVGALTGTFVAGGATQYSVTIADPEVTVTGGEGQVRADVDWTVPSADPSSGGADDVLLTTFDATGPDWVNRSLSVTPDWAGVLPADSAQATALGIPSGQPIDGKSWNADFLGALDSGLRGHFYASGKSSDAKKPPSPLTATAPAPAVTATTDADPAGLRVHVEGTGFAPTGTGIYVGVAEAGEIDPTNAAAYRGTRWLPASAIGADGSFAVDLEQIAPGDLDSSKSYEVHTQKAHGQSATDPSQNVRLPLSIDFTRFDRAPAKVTVTGLTRIYGQGGKVVASVPGASGNVTLSVGTWRKTQSLVEGRTTFAIPRTLRGGSYVARASYAGSTFHTPSTATSKVVIRAAGTRTAVWVRKAPKRKQTGVAIVRVHNASRTGVAPAGTVRVVMRKGKKSLVRHALVRKGTARVVLPTRPKGVWTTTFAYQGQVSKFTRSAKVVRIRVR